MKSLWFPPTEQPFTPPDWKKRSQPMPHTAHTAPRNSNPQAHPNSSAMAQASLHSEGKNTCADPEPPPTQLSMLHVALRETQLATKLLRDWPFNPESEIHGNLTVTLGALRRAVQAVQGMVDIEESSDAHT